jgi:hypothetical protein
MWDIIVNPTAANYSQLKLEFLVVPSMELGLQELMA